MKNKFAKMNNDFKYLASFARRLSRSLSDNQKEALIARLPEVKITLDADFHMLAEGYSKIELEIGCGIGEFVTKLALENPGTLYIACEPYLNGVASLLNFIKQHSIQNIRIFPDDVRLLLEVLPKDYLSNIYIICPDPWPKRKQNKRRLITAEFLNSLHASIKHQVTIVTDHYDYAQWMLNALIESKLYIINGNKIADFTTLPESWHYTKYQKFGLLNGGKIHFFEAKKIQQ